MKKQDNKKNNHFPQTVALLVGTIIGAGVLGIPYVIAQSGLFYGLLNILILGIIILLINLYVGEIALRTKKDHMLAGYAQEYLGRWGKLAMTITAFIGLYGAMIAYTLGEGVVLSSLFGGSQAIWGLAFFATFTIMIYFKLNFIAKSELFLSIIVIGLLILISILAIPHLDINNLQLNNNTDLTKIFLPYGVILFAFAGAFAIPEMEAELGKNKKQLKSAIIIGSIIPLVLYALFAVIVLGVTGINTTEVATIGLGTQLGGIMPILGNLFAIFAMATSFILVGYSLKWMYHYDYGLSNNKSWLLTWIIPLLFLTLFDSSFIGVVGLTGAIAGGIDGILIMLITMQAKKKGTIKPAYSMPLNWLIMSILIIVFLLGIIYQFLF